MGGRKTSGVIVGWCCVGIEGTKQEGFLKILKEVEVLWDSSAVMNCI